jgi:adenine deaminase
MEEIEGLIDVALGEKPADLVIRDGNLVNVYTGEILDHQSVAVKDRRIAYVGQQIEPMIGDNTRVVDAAGHYLTPGLIDGHNHVDHVYRCSEFVRCVLPKGTTTVVTETSAITNALGVEGLRWFIEDAMSQPMRFFILAPPLVPPYPRFESSRPFGFKDFVDLIKKDFVVGVGETYWTRVLEKDRRVLRQYAAALCRSKILDGHAAGAKGRKLQAYVAAGTASCHETLTLEEAVEKLRLGMHVMIREGFIRQDLEAVHPIKDEPIDFRRVTLVSDTMSPEVMVQEGLMNVVLKKAVSLGFDPVRAVQMASVNAAEHHRLKGLGGIAPGRLADILVVKELKDFDCAWVIVDGEIVAEDGTLGKQSGSHPYPSNFCHSIRIQSVCAEDFRVQTSRVSAKVRVARTRNETITDGVVMELEAVNGSLSSDPERDILKVAVINKSREKLQKGLGFVQGIGLKRGAVASSLVWDTYNILALGVSDREMALATNRLREMQGGIVVIEGERILAKLAMPIGGVISDLPMETIAHRIDDVNRALQALGSPLPRPYLVIQTLPFTGLPFLRPTDKGIFDLRKKEMVDLIVSEGA